MTGNGGGDADANPDEQELAPRGEQIEGHRLTGKQA